MVQPFYKASRKTWYVEIKGKQTNLGPDKDAAFAEFYRMMAGEQPVTSKTPAVNLLDQFLVWTQEHRAPETYNWYLKRLQSFATHLGPRRKVHEIKPGDVDKWLGTLKGWGPNSKNGACRAVARAFNWAVKKQLIPSSPVKGMERPAYEPSEECLTVEQWQQVIALVKPTDSLYDLIWFLHDTGCRPHEARILEARNFDRKKRRFVLSLLDSKGKQYRRVVRLNDRAFEIATRRCLKHPEGPIFRTRTGAPWTRFTLRSRFSDLSKKLGFRVFPYILRHTFVTEALLRGVDPITVALLVGHKDATMIMRVYSHLVQHDDFLAEQLAKVTEDVA